MSGQASVNQIMDNMPHLEFEWEAIEVLWKEQNFCPELYICLEVESLIQHKLTLMSFLCPRGYKYEN